MIWNGINNTAITNIISSGTSITQIETSSAYLYVGASLVLSYSSSYYRSANYINYYNNTISLSLSTSNSKIHATVAITLSTANGGSRSATLNPSSSSCGVALSYETSGSGDTVTSA